MMHGGNQVRSHLQREHRQRQRERHEERLLQPVRLGVAGLRLPLGVVVLGGDGMGLVSHLLHGGDQRLRLGSSRVE